MYLSNNNSKLKKSNIFSFGIPAGDTCPGAKNCALGCYAKQGFFVMPKVKAAQKRRLELTKSKDFIKKINAEIYLRGVKTLRIHDSGDFYSVKYLESWLEIIRANPKVNFYCYTKMIPLFKSRVLPNNFKVVFSFGGKWDSQIIPETMPHSRVFESLEELKKYKYSDATKNDEVAMKSRKVGLVYHGAKSKKWLTERQANESI